MEVQKWDSIGLPGTHKMGANEINNVTLRLSLI